jgi:multiple sugar transport system substrate-binding protein
MNATEAAFNSKEAVDGVFVLLHPLRRRGLTADDTLELNSAQTDARFGEGYTFAFMSGPWLISLARDWENQGWVQEAAENMAFAQIPAGPGGQYTFIGGSNLAIMKSCPHPEEAADFVKFLLSKESQIRYANSIGMLPTTLAAQSDPIFTQDPLFSVFIEAGKHGKTSENIVEWGQLENTLQSALASLWEDVSAKGYGTPIDREIIKARLDEAAETVNTLLKQ